MKAINSFDAIADILGVEQSALPASCEEYPLRHRIIDMASELFEKWGHSPSMDHWRGLAQIAATYESMATGEFGSTQQNYRYMSSLPPGMGKTTVAIQGTKALLSDPEFDSVGVIYFLSRLEEIATLVSLMELDKEDVGVLTSDEAINALGNPAPEKARVLFTTQQRLEAYSKNGTSFAEMKDLRYKGKVRTVRIWDEAILPSMALTLSKYDLARLPSELGQLSPELADTVLEFAFNLNSLVGDQIQMPDIDKTGLDLDAFRSNFKVDSDKEIAEAFWYLSGHVVRVRKDDYSGNVTLGYEDILPPDLAPMLILDASGGLRKTYRFWQDDRGELYPLHSPHKSYSGLTIHHWNKGAGKKKHRDFRTVSEIADGIVKMVSEIPSGEEILIVHHKVKPGKNQPDIVKAIRSKLPDRSGEVYFVNWGRHTATNEFKDVRHVILAGILNYDQATYEAMGRGAKALSVDDDLSAEDFTSVRIGEISHHIFQAAGRGAIRKTVNGGCPDGSHLYVIFSTRSGTGFPREQLEVIFPEAIVVDWKPDSEVVEKRLTGRVREAYEFVTSYLSYHDEVTTTEVRQELGMNRNNWNDNVLKHEDFLPSLKLAGVAFRQRRGKPGVFCKA